MIQKGKVIVVHDKMQDGYRYVLSESIGKNFADGFNPDLTPAEMLELGVFGGKYLTDCQDELPKSWFAKAKLSPVKADPKLNFFKKKASQSLRIWRQNGWINEQHDPRGWFQWYCRYYLGRRLPREDARQIRRWRAVTRHISQVKRHCKVGDFSCRPVQRQAILHWAYDSRLI